MDDLEVQQLLTCLEGISDRLEGIHETLRDVLHNQGEYSAYTLKDVVEGLWEVEKAVRDM